MIADAGTGSSFGGLFKYLMHGRSRGLQDYLLGDPERVAWTATRNIPLDDPQLSARIMEATAYQNDRVQKPVYHLSLSAAPVRAAVKTMERGCARPHEDEAASGEARSCESPRRSTRAVLTVGFLVGHPPMDGTSRRSP